MSRFIDLTVIVIAVLASLFGTARADLVIRGQGPEDEPATCVERFRVILEKCTEHSQVVRDLLNAIEETEDGHDVEITVGSGRKDVFVDSFGARFVDIDDLESIPCPERRPRPVEGEAEHERGTGAEGLEEWVFPDGVPKWAPTRCELLVHILREYLEAVLLGESHKPSHERAIEENNRYREEIGQDGRLVSVEWKTHYGGLDLSGKPMIFNDIVYVYDNGHSVQYHLHDPADGGRITEVTYD